MIGYFLLGLALLILLLLVGRLVVSMPPRQLLTAGKWVGLSAIGGVTVFLALTGRLSWALTSAAAFIPWIVRFIERNRPASTGRAYTAGRGSGQTSQVETATLRMTLDHDTGELDGDILAGRFAGRRLSELTLADLQALLHHCRSEDPPAVPLLETYLDRHHDQWRAAAGDGPHGRGDGDAGADTARTSQTMTREEAYRVLGLEPGASDEAVRAAHRRLIAGLHPDHGGSSFLAALINRARDTLLDRRQR